MATPKLNLPTITGNETADVPRDFNALANAIDTIAGAADGLATLDPDGKVLANQLNVSAPADASTTQKGIVQLNDNTDSTSITQAATANAVRKVAEDAAAHQADLASQEIGKGADIIGLPDPNSLFIANTVGAAMQELFTNVSDGKSLVGGAITDVDDSVVIPADPTFIDLVNAISGISTGKKVALGGYDYSNDRYIEVHGLDFKPSIYGHIRANSLVSASGFSLCIKGGTLLSRSDDFRTGYDTNSNYYSPVFTVYDDGFRIDKNTTVLTAITWFAVE